MSLLVLIIFVQRQAIVWTNDLNHTERIQMALDVKLSSFHLMEYIWKCYLLNVRHLSSTQLCLSIVPETYDNM